MLLPAEALPGRRSGQQPLLAAIHTHNNASFQGEVQSNEHEAPKAEADVEENFNPKGSPVDWVSFGTSSIAGQPQ